MNGENALRGAAIVSDFFPNLGDALVESPGRAEIFHSPDCLEDLIAAENAAAMLMQKSYQSHLSRGEGKDFSSDGDLIGGRINPCTPDFDGGRGRFLCAMNAAALPV